MTTSMNNSQPGSGREVSLRRELIVIAKPEVQLRVSGPSVSSRAGADTTSLNNLLASEGATLELLFGTNEDNLEQEAIDIASTASEPVPNPSVYYCVQAPDEKLDELAARLIEQDVIEAAYVKPAAELPTMTLDMAQEQLHDDTSMGINDMTPLVEEAPAVTPNFVNRQGYLNPAPEGIDARYAWTFNGGTGADINIIDLEWGWNFNHEDLRNMQGGVVGGINSSNNNHGTAVIGEIGGDRNNFGVTGICPDAIVSAVAFSMPTATAIRLAADRLQSGDIMLLEIHRAGPRFNYQRRDDQQGYIAVEWWPDDFAAIRYAIAKGIIVVEAAGNGRQNFDDALYNQRPSGFPLSWRNPLNPVNPSSGAVVVGAGAPPPGTHGRDHGPDRSRLDFSNYGARVDTQGWGREVTTTGYGDLQGGSNTNRLYGDQFSGTSSASPIVTGALGCVQGILKAANLPLLKPDQARQLLRNTGSPQQDAPERPRTERIGNRPNLRQLISQALALTPGNYSGVWLPGSGSYYLWANASWSSFKAKWEELAQKGLRLVDLEVHPSGNSNRYSGVWLPGSGSYYLWVNTNWHSFKAKWEELAQKGLRLVDIELNNSIFTSSIEGTPFDTTDGFGGGELPSDSAAIDTTDGFGGGELPSDSAAIDTTDGFGGGELPADSAAIDTTDGFGGGELPADSAAIDTTDGFGGGELPSDLIS